MNYLCLLLPLSTFTFTSVPEEDPVPNRFIEDRDLSGQESIVNAERSWHVTDAGLKRLRSYVLRGEIDIYMQSKVRRLILDGTRITDAGLRHLDGEDGLIGLEELSLAGTRVSDAGLKVLEGLSHLRELRLGQTFLVDGGASGPRVTIAGIDRLKETLPECTVTHEVIRLELTELQRSRFQLWSRIADVGLNRKGEIVRLMIHDGAELSLNHYAGLADLAQLTEFYAGGRFAANQVKQLAALKNMRYLCLRGCLLNEQAFRELGSMSDLRILDVSSCPVNDPDLENFETLRNLVALDLRFTRAATSGLQKLRRALPTTKFVFDPWRVVGLPYRDLNVNPQFELVDVGTIGYRKPRHELAAQLADLLEHPTLERMSLRHSALTDEEMKMVARMSNLKELDLGNTEITSAGVKQLAGLKKLETVNLWHTKITGDGGLMDIKGLRNLRSLELDETKIDDDAIVPLAEMSGLRYLELWHTGVTRAGVARLQSKRPELEIKSNPRR